MTPTLRLGRILGIEVGFNWSLVLVFLLVTWSLASGISADLPGKPAAEYWVAGIAGALAFYACLLAHELSHALVARGQGVKVLGITLWLFGGVSRLEGEPSKASSEAAITVVGPLTSLVVAALCYGLALLVPARGATAVAADLLSWLAYINLVLAVFNLVPAFPLDGGRLLSSLLWWRSGSRRRGVHQAVQVSRVIAYLMIGLGLLELFMNQVLDGVWIAFLGWFLLSAGSAEETGATVRDLLRSVPVSAAMSSPVVTVPDWLTIEQFVSGVAPGHAFTTYPLHDARGNLTGVVRLGELLGQGPGRGAGTRLLEVAHPLSEVPRAAPGEDLSAMLERAGAALRLRALVFEGERLVGIVSPSDVARLITLRQAAESGRSG